MTKSLITFIALSLSLHASAESNYRERLDAYHNYSLAETHKEKLFKDLKALVKTALPEKFHRLICRNATKKEYAQFMRVVSFVKTKVNNPDFTALTAGEISYFIECEDGTNAINYNFTPDTIKVLAEGLTGNTRGLINNAGRILLEPDHKGRTPLMYAEEKRDEARGNKNFGRASKYQMIMNEIIGAINDLDKPSSKNQEG